MYQSFIPKQNLMMGPGPSTVPASVLAASARPTIGHLDPDFIGLMDEIKALLREVFQTENTLTFPVSAPGSAGMEMCVNNLVEPGDKVLVCINGVFGGRLKECVERCGGVPVIVEDEWGQVVDPEKVQAALTQDPEIKTMAFVHAETSTGASSDVQALCKLAQSFDVLTIVDAVTSLGGTPLYVDRWGIDAAYSGSQKCLSCPPGLSPVTFNQRAVKKIKSRKTKVQSWFLDLNLIMNYWEGSGARAYHHTAPVNAMYALHESLLLLHAETLEKAWARHRATHLALREGLEALGFRYLVAEEARLPQLNSVFLPDNIENEAAWRSVLLRDHQIEVGGGLGALAGKIWRIGLMGYTAQPENVERLLDILRQTMPQFTK